MRFRDPTEWLIAALSASLIAILCGASTKENVERKRKIKGGRIFRIKGEVCLETIVGSNFLL